MFPFGDAQSVLYLLILIWSLFLDFLKIKKPFYKLDSEIAKDIRRLRRGVF